MSSVTLIGICRCFGVSSAMTSLLYRMSSKRDPSRHEPGESPVSPDGQVLRLPLFHAEEILEEPADVLRRVHIVPHPEILVARPALLQALVRRPENAARAPLDLAEDLEAQVGHADEVVP